MSIQPYQHLLTAVDFSPGTETVVARARDLSQRYMARVSLVHVVEPMLMEYTGEMVLPEDLDLERRLVDSGRERIAELGERLHARDSDCHVLVGSPKTEIVRIAEDNGVDLILVGSHGRHGLALLLGSTANAVLHHAPCDVIAVRITED
jgi:universal stress protein A